MDYKGQAELMKKDAQEFDGPGYISGDLRCGAKSITDLLARAEAAEARAEKAKRERDAYKEMICKERPCSFCAGYTGEWNPECIRCDRCTKEYRPQFRLREWKEE